LLRAPSAVLVPVAAMPCVARRGRPRPQSRAGPAVLQVFLR
jgi:hypothetical protein